MRRTWTRRMHLFAVAGLALATTVCSSQPPAQARLVAIVVVDGLRPDSVNPTDTPTIARLRDEGTEYVNSHSVFPTVTRVNSTVLATGALPSLNGIVGNSMFVAGVNDDRPFATGDQAHLLALEAVSGQMVTTDTLGEILQRNGRRLVTLSSGSTGSGLLLNATARRGGGVVIHGQFEEGESVAYPKDVNDAILERFGAAPTAGDAFALMNWTDTVLREYVLPDLRPDVVITWMGPLDDAQHDTGVGSPASKEALATIDASIAQTIAAIESLGLSDRTDIIVTSDHGFAHHAAGVDVMNELVAAGLTDGPESTDLIVASQSESLLFYLPAGDDVRLERLVRFLQARPWVDVIFTRGGTEEQGSVPGTFSLDVVGLAHPTRGPDVAVSLAWTSEPNAFGVPGSHTIASAATGPLEGAGSGHGGLNPWVVRNTFVAWGPDFKRAMRIEAPVSLADVAPTVLAVVGADPGPSGSGRGRVLRELLRDGPPAPGVTTRTLTTGAGAYRASLQVSSVDGHDYVDGGSRTLEP